MARLGDICKFQSGGTPAKGEASYFNGTIPWITTVSLNGSVINADNAVDWITEKAIQKSAAKIVPANSVMVGTRVGVGKVAINCVPMSTNQDIISLVDIDESEWSKLFICKFILGKGSYLNSQARGATIKGIKIETLAGLQLPDITLEKQRRIACVIDKIDELIALRKEQLTKQEHLVKSRFIELFDSIDNCKISKFCDECEEITAGGDRPKDTSEIRTEDYPYPVFANAATNEGLLCFSREYKIEKPCVTIAARGCTVGFTAIRYEKFTPIVRLISLVPKETVTPIYLKHYIDIKMNIEGNGAAQPQLTIPMIKNMEIMVPPIELQNQFAAFVEQTDKSKLAIQQSLDKLEMLKKSLMQQYFG